MSLQFILGNSGSGKTHYLYETVIALAQEQPGRTFYVIVPEQFTMQTQREFVERHPAHAILNIDVVSFGRLAYRVFEELGLSTLQILEDTGKNLILRKIAMELESDLQVLNGNIHKMGYVDEIKSFLTELMQYRVSVEELNEQKEQVKNEPLLYSKLSDVERIYRAFLERLSGSYITSEEILEQLAGVAGQSKLLRDSVFVLDGFTGFTPVQQSFLREAFTVVSDVYVALTMDVTEDPFQATSIEDLFYLSKKTIATLCHIASETGMELAEPIYLKNKDKHRFIDAKALYHLEQNLFRKQSKRLDWVEADDGEAHGADEIQIYSFSKPAEELEFVADKITELVQKEGYYYKDFAVVSGDIASFEVYTKKIFDDYQIPYFLDQTHVVLYHPFVECIRGVLEICDTGFGYEPVMRTLRTGLWSYDRTVIDYLDNYLLAYGIRGHQAWSEKWIRKPKWLTDEQLQELNELRADFVKQLEPVYEVFQKKDVTIRTGTRALYQFIVELQVAKQLKERAEKLRLSGDAVRAKEYDQIYGAVMELFDKLVALLGEEVVAVKEYEELFGAGIEAVSIGVIPPTNDTVLVGDIERSRLEHVKVLFFIGVNDGVIPKSHTDGGILSQLERERLFELSMELAPTARERAFIQRFYLYMNLTKPSKQLFISYARADADGSSKRRSYLIHLLLRMFPGLQVQEHATQNIMHNMRTPKSSMNYLVKELSEARMRPMSPEGKALFHWYQKQGSYEEVITRLLEAAFYEKTPLQLQKDIAKKLYGSVLSLSVTRLEKYAQCAFAHFLNYGLGLQSRETDAFAPNDFGNVLHDALNKYSRELQAQDENWFEVSDEKSKEIEKEAFHQAFLACANDYKLKDFKNQFFYGRMEAVFKRTVWALQSQIRKGRFQPVGYEWGFGYTNELKVQEFVLSEEERMSINGRIDRVDVLEDEQQVYVKITDYKSGKTQFSLLSLYHGLQLQLVVYLNAAQKLIEKQKSEKEILPAGVFYYHMEDPIVEATGSPSETEILEQVLEKLKLDGVVNDADVVIDGMDGEFGSKSNVIPVTRKKDGSLGAYSKAYSTKQLQLMSAYVNDTIEKLGSKLLSGEISASPYMLGGQSGCQYCDYHSVCGFDQSVPGCNYRKLEQIKDENTILDQMKNQMESENENEMDQRTTTGN